jgi:hypothetical protein
MENYLEHFSTHDFYARLFTHDARLFTHDIQANDISQVGMISASQADSVRHLQGLHVAHLIVIHVGKTVPVRITNTTTHEIESPKGCESAEFCPILIIITLFKQKYQYWYI